MTQEKSSRERRLLILVVLLLITNVLTAYFWLSSDGQKTIVITEKEQMVQDQNLEIQELKDELETFRGKNTQLDSLIDVAQSELDAKNDEIAKLLKSGKESKKLIARLKREKANLLTMRQKYMGQIDSLLTANKLLTEENQVLKADIQEEKSKTEKLTDENVKLFNKLAVGAILKASNIVAEGIKVKSSGREVSVTRARQTEKIKVCFTLLENRVAESGNKDVMVRIVGPEGSTLYLEEAGSGKFMSEGKETLYTASGKIDYQNQDVNSCVYFTKGSDYAKGDYQVEVYADGYLIGKSSFNLR